MPEQNTTNPSEPTGSTAQQLTDIQSNGQQTPIIPQQSMGNQSTRRVDISKVQSWLNVLGVFLIPLMIGVYTIAYNVQQSKISQQQYDNNVKAAKESHQADLTLQTDQQRETALASYIHDMKDLISTEGLQKSKPGAEVRVIARAQTLITLRQLDGIRKGIVMQFLSEAGLITGNDIFIDLSSANLSGAYLDSATLRSAHLGGADLTGADLKYADLKDANLNSATLNGATLRGAYLSGADLRDATLRGADLRDTYLFIAHLGGADLKGADLKGATMPDGSLHP